MPSVLTDLLTLSEVSRLLPGRPHPSTIWRWRRKGIGGVKLRTVRIGGRTYVQRHALEEFIEAMTRASDVPQTRERSDETRSRLAAAGLVEGAPA
jgi:hypothetical protein